MTENEIYLARLYNLSEMENDKCFWDEMTVRKILGFTVRRIYLSTVKRAKNLLNIVEDLEDNDIVTHGNRTKYSLKGLYAMILCSNLQNNNMKEAKIFILNSQMLQKVINNN